jgi:Tol biopolymer transport system component
VRCLALAVLTSTLAVVPSAADGADEAFPGRNGLIVFASDRTTPREPEIYAASLTGAAPRNVTRNAGWDSRPAPSPDGRRIAFHAASSGGSRRGIYLMDVDGSDRRLVVEGERPAWSPDSRSLAYEDGRGRIAVVDLEMLAVRILVEGSLPSWSPDGRLIAFLRGFQLFVVDAGGGEPRRLAPGLVVTGVAVFEPAWSPDGTRIVLAGGDEEAGTTFPRTSEIHVVRVSDGRATAITSTGLEKTGPTWSPDGTAIVFAERILDEPRAELVLIGPDGSGRRALTHPSELEFDDHPAWSPDGSLVAFVRGRAPTDAREVLVVRRDGTGLRRLSQARSALPAYEGPAWIRDNRTVIFARRSADLDDDLFVVDPGRPGARRLTDNTVRDWDPAWSPDGSRIAFVRTLESGPFGRNDELFVMRADGSGVRRLTRYRHEDLAPAWSPDGSRIAFARRVERTGLVAIHTIRPDGTGLRGVTLRPPGLHSGPAWSPDGPTIAYVADTGAGAGGNLHVVNADGSRSRPVARIADGVLSPEWSPDGRLLAVTGLTGCGGPCVIPALYLVRPDGSGLRKLADDLGGSLAWSPDGRSLAIAAGPIVRLDLRTRRRTEIVGGDATHASPDWQPRCTRIGTPRGDRLGGSTGRDLLCGLGGRDRLRGGRGEDRLFGAGGDDRIEARDGAFDVVGCGPGRDSVVADRRDLVGEDCERVLR